MPELQWEPQDVLECFVVEPEVEEYGCWYRYAIPAGGQTLELRLRPYDSVVDVELRGNDGTDGLFPTFSLAVRGRVRYRREKAGDFLEFGNCVILPHLFNYYQYPQVFDGAVTTGGVTVEVWAHPEVKVRFRGE